MKKFAVLVLAFVLAVPVISFASVFDEEKVVTDKSFKGYKSVGVKLFSTEDVKYENVDDEEMDKMKEFLGEVQERLAKSTVRALKEQGLDAFIVDGKKNAGKADIIIDGEITQINLGSTATRLWVGWGAGSAGVSVEGQVKEAKSGDTLVKFEHENSSGLRESYNKWEMVLHEAQDLGDKFGEFFEKLRKK